MYCIDSTAVITKKGTYPQAYNQEHHYGQEGDEKFSQPDRSFFFNSNKA